MNKPAISRRTLLRGLGTAIALPWLEAMSRPAPLIASPVLKPVLPDGPPVRAAFLYVPNGMHMPHWKPERSPTEDFETPKILEAVKQFHDQTTIFSGLTLNGARALGDGGGDHARSVASFLTGAHPRKTHGDNIKNGRLVQLFFWQAPNNQKV